MTDRQPPQPSRQIAVPRDAAEDVLALMRPGLYIRSFLSQLEQNGDRVLARLFNIACYAEKDSDALKAIQTIQDMTNAKDILAVAMGLKQRRGRPGEDGEREAEAAQTDWANAIDLTENPEGSGNYEAPDDES